MFSKKKLRPNFNKNDKLSDKSGDLSTTVINVKSKKFPKKKLFFTKVTNNIIIYKNYVFCELKRKHN